MAALQVKQICMYLELAELPKIINTKLSLLNYVPYVPMHLACLKVLRA